MVEMTERIGLKHIRMERLLRLENFTRKMEIMIAGVVIIGVLMVVESEPLILL
jgi:hypothetical protein